MEYYEFFLSPLSSLPTSSGKGGLGGFKTGFPHLRQSFGGQAAGVYPARAGGNDNFSLLSNHYLSNEKMAILSILLTWHYFK
jgi:hypothetical protein